MFKTYKAGLALLLLLCTVVLAGAAYATSTPAKAPGAAENANREALMHFAANNVDFDNIVENLARDLYRRQVSDCGDIDQAVRQLPTAYGSLSFPTDTSNAFPPPDNGIWVEHVKIKGCSHVYQINMLSVARRGLKPLILALLPGETNADPAIQRNAERMGATVIKKADAATCADEAHAGYTRMLGFRQMDGSAGKVDQGQGWFEQWNFKFCNKDVPTQMAFIPDTAGGFDIKARVIGAVEPQVPVSKPDMSKPDVTGAAAPAPQADTDKPLSTQDLLKLSEPTTDPSLQGKTVGQLANPDAAATPAPATTFAMPDKPLGAPITPAANPPAKAPKDKTNPNAAAPPGMAPSATLN